MALDIQGLRARAVEFEQRQTLEALGFPFDGDDGSRTDWAQRMLATGRGLRTSQMERLAEGMPLDEIPAWTGVPEWRVLQILESPPNPDEWHELLRQIAAT